MNYSTFVPNSLLHPWVECYWSVKGTDTSIQRIIPDGYSELIFHLGDPYKRIKGDNVASQGHTIIAGQINQPIFIQPTGDSDIFGIKFKPTALWQLTGLRMSHVANETIDLAEVSPLSALIYRQLAKASSVQERVRTTDDVLLSCFFNRKNKKVPLDTVVDRIRNSRGAISVRELSTAFKMSTRKMERLFQEQVGITAKQYSRLVRFNHVFQLMQQPHLTKVDISLLAGYFDQSHFNNEFREFTGENPETYFGQEHAFANFFMNR